MALKPFNREKYQKMVNYIRGNVGGVLALYDPKPGELAKNYAGQYVQIIRATDNLEEFKEFVFRYCDNYKYFSDFPVLEFNEEFTLCFIKPSFDSEMEAFREKILPTRQIKK